MATIGNIPTRTFTAGGYPDNDFKIVSIVNGVGVTQLIAAPGAHFRLIVRQIQVQNEASQTSITANILFGGNARWRIHMPYEGDGFLLDNSAGNHWVLPTNVALQIELSAAGNVGVCVSYSVEPV